MLRLAGAVNGTASLLAVLIGQPASVTVIIFYILYLRFRIESQVQDLGFMIYDL